MADSVMAEETIMTAAANLLTTRAVELLEQMNADIEAAGSDLELALGVIDGWLATVALAQRMVGTADAIRDVLGELAARSITQPTGDT